MKILGALVISAAVLFTACASVSTAPGPSQKPEAAQYDSSTPSGRAALIAELKEAANADKMDATSWTDDNASLDVAWYHKQQEVQSVIARLASGEQVPNNEIQHALDNSLPHQLGGYPN
jgi:hypothetical protein